MSTTDADTPPAAKLSPEAPDPKRSWFEPVCAMLMAFASLSTAWCSYQSSRWSGQTGELDGFADGRERDATAIHLEARQFESVYVRLVMEVIDAKLAGDEKRMRFYTDRFPEDIKAAWEKWLALKPFEDASAPPHPFVPSLYTSRFEKDIRAARNEAAAAQAKSQVTGHNASSYLGNTVLLATVLFFAGTAGRFDHRRVRWSSLAFAVALFLYAAVRMLMLPVA